MVDVTDLRAIYDLLNVNILMTLALIFTKIDNFVEKSTDIHVFKL